MCLSVLSKVFITPDMNIKERENNKALRTQLAELNKDGRKYKIKKTTKKTTTR